MKYLLTITFCFISLMSCAKEHNIQQKMPKIMEQTTDDEAKILALTRKFTQLMIARNTTELGKIVDENFSLTHITGYEQPRAEWFKEIETERMKYYSAEEVNYSVKIDGNNAVFVQQNRLDARIWGSRNVWRLQQTMALEKRDGEWIILKSVAKTF